MSLARATISGKIYRAPEKRFTSNNIPITGFTLDISNNTEEEILIRVNAFGNLADVVAQSINKGDEVVVEGRLQNAVATAEDGSERKIMEIEANSVMKISAGIVQPMQTTQASSNAKSEEFADELIGEDEIPF